MKTKFLYLLIFVAGVVNSCTLGIRQGPPNALIEVIPSSPYPNYVWTPGYYSYRNRVYTWNAGRYRQPSRRTTIWQPGHYNQNKRGFYKYKRGCWK